MIANKKLQALKMKELSELMEGVNGNLHHPKIAAKVKELRKIGVINNNPQFQEFVISLARLGIITV